MKRSIITHLLLLLTLIANSQIITKEEAELTASNFLYGQKHAIKETISYGNTSAKIFIVNFSPEGWALVSSDIKTRPIIGYSETGSFSKKYLNNNIKDWLDNQLRQIEHKDLSKDWSREWSILETGKLPILKSSSSVAPILKTEWDQGRNWNNLCPPYASGPNGKAYIGCVAVAMAQSLHNIKYPDHPVDSKTYALEPYGSIYTDFDKEAPYEWDKMSLTSGDNYNRQLLYNCAVAVEMDFGGSGSGAYTTRVPFAFRKYFKMDDQVTCIKRENYPIEKDWTDILKDELRKGNVIIYSGDPGTGEAGHAFNIDGFTASGYFHFNWGWSGSQNGNFSINNIAPSSSNFNANQKAVIGISLPYSGPTDISLSNNTIPKDANIGSTIGTIDVIDISENETFEFEVLEKDFLSFKKSEIFIIEDNSLKTKSTLSSTINSYTITIRVTDSENQRLDKEFIIKTSNTSFHTSSREKRKWIYPNPASTTLRLIRYENVKEVCLTDLSGKVHLQKNKDFNMNIDLSELKSGIYILKLRLKNEELIFEKLIIE